MSPAATPPRVLPPCSATRGVAPPLSCERETQTLSLPLLLPTPPPPPVPGLGPRVDRPRSRRGTRRRRLPRPGVRPPTPLIRRHLPLVERRLLWDVRRRVVIVRHRAEVGQEHEPRQLRAAIEAVVVQRVNLGPPTPRTACRHASAPRTLHGLRRRGRGRRRCGRGRAAPRWLGPRPVELKAPCSRGGVNPLQTADCRLLKPRTPSSIDKLWESGRSRGFVSGTVVG